jgi:hypothetical protein
LNCDGVFEGDKCTVKCKDASFFLNGPHQIFCKGGNWVDATGNVPTPKCQDIGEHSFHVIFERKTATHSLTTSDILMNLRLIVYNVNISARIQPH